MKPTILCGECQKPIELGSKFCEHCGKPVTWDTETTEAARNTDSVIQCERCGTENDSASTVCSACGESLVGVTTHGKVRQKKVQRRQARKGSDKPLAVNWKMALGFVGVLAVAVVGLELFTANQFTEVPHTHDDATQQGSAANMQALQQIEEMEQRLTANPNDQPLRLQLANFLHDARFYDKAIQRYHEYLENNPKDVDARVDLGICYYEVDRTAEAKQEMLKALEYNSKHVLGHFNLGIVHLRIAQSEMDAGNQGKADAAMTEANEWFRKTVDLDPNGSAGQRARRFLADHALQPNPNLLTN